MAQNTQSLEKGLALGGLGFGIAATLAPSVFVSSYGMRATPTTNIFVRLFGTRSVALSALLLAADDAKSRHALIATTLALNTADTVLIATAGGVPSRSRVLGLLTTGAFAGLAGWLFAQQ